MSGERMRHNDFTPGPDPDQDSFDTGNSGMESRVDVVNGIHAHSFPLAGMTVRQARHDLEERLNIDPLAVASVDGREADEDTILIEGQTLSFANHVGEKGFLFKAKLHD